MFRISNNGQESIVDVDTVEHMNAGGQSKHQENGGLGR